MDAVPVVTLRGDRHSGRVGASLLTSAGLHDCIAASRGDYIGTAAALASDITRLRELRAGLRAQLLRSALCDGDTFARRFESALLRGWEHWLTAD